MAIDPVPPNPVPSTTGTGPSYQLAYGIAVANAIVGGAGAILAGAGLTFHPSWLSADVAATAGVVTLICMMASQFLPPVTRSPASRETKYLLAGQGVLPADIAKKFPLVVPADADVVQAPVQAPVQAKIQAQ